MKIKIIYLFFILATGFTLFLSNSSGRADSANWGNTGAPGDQTLANGSPRVCQSCHGNGTIQVDMDIELMNNGVPVQAYMPGQTYDVTVSVNHVGGPSPSGYGFQILSLVDNNESDVDGWSNPGSNVKIATASNTGRSYAEQNGVSSSSTFSFSWTAPDAGSGGVTFYSCGTGVNANGTSGGDGAACTTLQLAEDTGVNTTDVAAIAKLNIAPNPSHGMLNIGIENLQLEDFTIEISNASGQSMHIEQLNTRANRLQKTMDISQYPSGIYFLQLYNDDAILSKRFIKQ